MSWISKDYFSSTKSGESTRGFLGRWSCERCKLTSNETVGSLLMFVFLEKNVMIESLKHRKKLINRSEILGLSFFKDKL